YRGYTRGPGLRGARGRGNRDTYKPWSATAARGSRDRRDWSRAGSRAAIHRAADRTGAHLRRASSNRDGERAAARRIAPTHRGGRGAQSGAGGGGGRAGRRIRARRAAEGVPRAAVGRTDRVTGGREDPRKPP